MHVDEQAALGSVRNHAGWHESCRLERSSKKMTKVEEDLEITSYQCQRAVNDSAPKGLKSMVRIGACMMCCASCH